MNKTYKKIVSLILFWLFIIFLLCFALLNDFSPMLAQNQKMNVQSINKYFNRDLPEPLFSKLRKLGEKLMTQKTTASRHLDRDIDIWAIRSDGKSKPFPLTVDNEWDDEMPDWSPDDQFIAYVSAQSGNKKIWIMKNDGTKKEQMTKGSSPDSYPLWSPDGHHITFIRNESLFFIEMVNRVEQQISKNIQVERICAWSRDGKNILFIVREKDEILKLLEIDLETQNVRDTNLQANLHSLWSNLNLCAQKDSVVFETFEIDNYDIAIQDLIMEKQWKLTRGFSHDRHPKWSHDGNIIVFSSNRKTPEIPDIKW